MKQTGLILEGGGMRGLYTCGVLDCFLDHDIQFPYIIGVSAGACNAVSYISGQKGRNLEVNTAFVNDWRYMSFRNLLREKSYFGMKFIFEDIPNRYIPFDYNAFQKSACDLLVVTTDCDTGKPYYFDKGAFKENFDVLKATSSLPLISPIMPLKGIKHLDGGIVEPIPIKKSIKDGNLKNVVILTRSESYRKSPEKMMSALKFKYAKYPKLVERMNIRHQEYNDTLDLLQDLEAKGDVFIIRPRREVDVDRLEKNVAKLKNLYTQGYEDTQNVLKDLYVFLERNLDNEKI